MRGNEAAIDRILETMRTMQTGVSDRVMGHFTSIQDLDFTLPQFMVLYYLSRHREDPLTVSQLASVITLSQPATSQLIDRLLQRGLLMRRENPEDRRQKLISISDEGVSLLDRIENRREEKMRAMFAAIPTETLERMQHALAELHDIFEQVPIGIK
jgi:DNA-binding MarR family transcriptional regulator